MGKFFICDLNSLSFFEVSDTDFYNFKCHLDEFHPDWAYSEVLLFDSLLCMYFVDSKLFGFCFLTNYILK